MHKLDGLGIAILRVTVGLIFVIHGLQKLFVVRFSGVAQMLAGLGVPLPDLAAVALTLVEFLGGLLLMGGLFTRGAAVLLAIDMAVALIAVHLRNGFFLPGGFEYVLTLLAANIALALSGPGAYALDRLVRRDRIFS